MLDVNFIAILITSLFKEYKPECFRLLITGTIKIIENNIGMYFITRMSKKHG